MVGERSRELVVTRIIDAPIDVVWDAWTRAEQVAQWWGPRDHDSPHCEIDLREGGTYRFAMRAPAYAGGRTTWTSGTYREIVPHERLVFTQVQTDVEGTPLAAEALPEGFPAEVVVSIDFHPVGSLTELVITEQGWELGLAAVFAYAGMHESLDELAQALRAARPGWPRGGGGGVRA